MPGATDERAAVIIAAKDAQATVGRAVRSALAQPCAAEVVVIDDGSGDATAAAAEAADDASGRLTVHRLDQNRGPAEARNIAMGLTRAPLVCILDSDDFLLPGRLERLIGRMDGADMVADDLWQVKEGAEDGPLRRLLGDDVSPPFELSLRRFLLGNISRPGANRRELGFLKPLMRRSFLDRHQLRYDPTLRLGEDFIFYATALARGAKFRVVEPCGYVAVERDASLSGRHRTQDLEALLTAADALVGAHALTPDERAAFARYRRGLRGKLHHRRVLDAKRRKGWPGAVATLLSVPQCVPHVVINTFIRPGARTSGHTSLLQRAPLTE